MDADSKEAKAEQKKQETANQETVNQPDPLPTFSLRYVYSVVLKSINF